MSWIQQSVAWAARACGGALLRAGAERFEGVTIDSRTVTPGCAFVAIAGERVDGHRFCAAAAEAGAALLLVERPPEEALPGGAAVLQVPSTRAALTALARAWRAEVNPRVLAITGSAGKTTTKELCRNILALLGPTHSTPGNYNNDLGLPLTILGMPPGCRYLVAELGMNAPGEIAALSRLARPEVGLITCVAPVHLEGLGSVEAVAAAKAELLLALEPGAVGVVPADEPLLAPWAARLPRARRWTFGPGPGTRARLLGRQARGEAGARLRLALGGEEIAVEFPLAGAHNARNAAAAAAATLALGVEPAVIARGLALPPELGHRSRLGQLGPWRLFDDCYNANPAANEAALTTAVELAHGAPLVAALGAMLELGEAEQRLHRQVGRFAAGLPLALLLGVGPLGAMVVEGAREAGLPGERARAAADPEEAAELVWNEAPAGAWLLVKASRGARLERLIEALERRLQAGSPPCAALHDDKASTCQQQKGAQ